MYLRNQLEHVQEASQMPSCSSSVDFLPSSPVDCPADFASVALAQGGFGSLGRPRCFQQSRHGYELQ